MKGNFHLGFQAGKISWLPV